MKVMRLAPAVLLVFGSRAVAQEHEHAHEMEPAQPDAAAHTEHEGQMDAEMTGPLALPLARDGSGTSWLPDETPMRALHARVGGWQLMLHLDAFSGYDHQASDAGDGAITSTNWIMGMASHRLGPGHFMARAMLSLEPFTVGDSGYPLLLQTGETHQGKPLVDRQHPHDLFMELAARYALELGGGFALEVYGGPVGEPALGPTAFPHRASAMADPLAPIAHHWQDSTHISFGVLTLGVFNRWVKLEGSWFNGREPDETRTDFDLRGFDSFSARVSVNPAPCWSLQASYGFLDSPEELRPDVSVERVTASATYNANLGDRRGLATTAVWGRNIPSDGTATDSLLVEGALDLGKWGTTFGRAEYVLKNGHDFALPPPRDEDSFPVGEIVVGHVHDLPTLASFVPGIGVRGALGFAGDGLESRYGTRYPVGFMVFLRLTAAPMDEMHMGHMDMAAAKKSQTARHE